MVHCQVTELEPGDGCPHDGRRSSAAKRWLMRRCSSSQIAMPNSNVGWPETEKCMSRIAKKEKYLFLMNSFLNESLPYQEFKKKYFDLWRQDRDEERQNVQSSGERADLALITALDNGEITKEQFESQWRKLFRYENEKKKRLGEILDNVFTSLDVCATEPENTWEIDEQELRRIVEQAVKDIEALRVSEADDY